MSTKVGYFREGKKAAHSLDSQRLRAALEQTCRDLGREPDLVFLHNPEVTLAELPKSQALEVFRRACMVLSNASIEGLCGSWGISSWSPGSIGNLIDSDSPTPSTLMVRCGLTVGASTLDAAEMLRRKWNLPAEALWGMSPFGGAATDPVWEKFNSRAFLCSESPLAYSPMQAAFRAAFYLPEVNSVAVGADNPLHLRELIESFTAKVHQRNVAQYRELLRQLQRESCNSPIRRRASR